ncbi:nitroreductase family deazaflavin-dependent oxidoreductase [Agromyces kandeliae]|uniref:Nitroreductase family deazaflavin-dependent oxidoreductase n=1 Tax=Agromyces kandeliae TaxID=2666141 RepID=A0A6L5QXH3_9MICO|nr:nitroreductase family deazaflavin-dependent oxidoreductase [Agromyces kandeliae]MRX42369.1 nitroreductase family deazaflavin-dependent oxidoreductase [Agromyces kandeliae]
MPSVLQLTRAVVAPLTRTRLFRLVGPVILPPIEAVLGALSGGRLQLASLLVPSLVLHSVGARTGAPRHVHLMYTPDGRGRAIVAGTSFARDRHPGWTYNLIANPDAWITVRDRTLRVRATRVPAAERDAAWARIEAQWPGYRGYERDSGRVVRLFVLRPVAESEAPPLASARAVDGPLDASSASD